MLTAKLLVRLGAPLQLKSGETLPPVQPKPLNTCSLTIVPPSLRSELVRSYFAHSPHSNRAPTPSAAIQKANFVITIPSLTTCRESGLPPDGVSNRNFWDCLAAKGASRGRLRW